MTVLSDKEIRSRCIKPTFVIKHDGVEYYTHMTISEINKINTDILVKNEPVIADKLLVKRELTQEEQDECTPMITPFVDGQVRVNEEDKKILSYGLSSFGYDVRLADEFKIFTNIKSTIIDPLDFDQGCLVDHQGPYCIIPPNSYILGRTIEYFDIPDDVMVVCVGKSTYARCGAIVNVTPIEAGFKGHIVIEISNATSLPLKVYANQGVSQFLFFQGNHPCEVSYSDRNGKYHNQTGVQTALV